MDPDRNRLKQLDLLGSVGAGMLGAGIALVFAHWLQAFAVPALLIGLLVHGWAMFEKHRIERQAGLLQPVWSVWTYRACWAILAALIGYVALILSGAA